MNNLAARLRPYAPLFLRLGLAFVFLLFAIQKLSVPEQTRAEIQLLLDLGLGSAAAINYYMGLLELIVGLGLLFGFYTRHVSFLAAISLIGILGSFLRKYGLETDPNIYRDIALLGGAVSLWITGAGAWSIDAWRQRRSASFGFRRR